MSGNNLCTARSSDFASVRDEFSSWLDDIFPPSRQTNGRRVQHKQHRKVCRQQQDTATARLRRALPMELPQLIKPTSGRQTVHKHEAQNIDTAEDDDIKEPAGMTMIRNSDNNPRSRRQLPPRIKRSLSLPIPVLLVPDRHHRPPETRKAAASAAVRSCKHPSMFPELRYGIGQCFHRPGLSFFEHIPSRAFIRVVSTVIFLDRDAARRAGGEVLWLRTNAAGKIQRRVFPAAGCFLSNPSLRRRVALSLSCRENAGTAFAENSPCQAKSPYPAALLKIYRPDHKAFGRSSNDNNSNDDDGGDDRTGKKQGGMRVAEGGGSTDVLFLSNLSEIELTLLEAEGEGKSVPDHTVQNNTTQRQPVVPFPEEGDRVLVTRKLCSDSCTSAPGSSWICQGIDYCGSKSPEADAPKARDRQDLMPSKTRHTPATCAENSVLPSVPEEMKALPDEPSQLKRGLPGGDKAEVVRRRRPWAIQKYLKPEGQLSAWVVRVVWRRNRDPFCWILSGSDPHITAEMSGDGRTPGDDSACRAVRSTHGQAAWEAPKAFVVDMVATLEARATMAASTSPLRFDLMVADLIEDREGNWWLTQVKAFRLQKSQETPLRLSFASASSASPRLVPKGKRTRHGRSDEGCTNGEHEDKDEVAMNAIHGTYGDQTRGRQPRVCQPRSGIKQESKGLASHPPPPALPTSSPSTPPTIPTVAAPAAASMLRKRAETPRTACPGHFASLSTTGLGEKSQCPGLFCNTGAGSRTGRCAGPRPQLHLLRPQSASTRISSALESRRCGDRYSKGQAEGEELAAGRRGESIGERLSAQDEVKAPREETSREAETDAGGDGSPGPGEANPAFELPLKALVINAEVVRFRQGLAIRQQTAAEAEAGCPARSFDEIPANLTRSTISLAQAPSVDEPTQGDASLVESRSLAVLHKRDRVRLYDTVPLCAPCYREYSDNWRWWLARGTKAGQKAATSTFSSSQRRTKVRGEGRRTRAKKPPAATISADGAAFAGTGGSEASPPSTGGIPERVTCTRSRNLPLSLWLSSPRNRAIDNNSHGQHGDVSTTGGDDNRTGTRTHDSSDKSRRRKTPAARSEGGLRPPLLRSEIAPAAAATSHQTLGKQHSSRDNARAVDCQEQPSDWDGGYEGGERGAGTPSTSSSVNMFRARLDRRIDGISIPPYSKKVRDICEDPSLKRTAPVVDLSEKREPSSALSAPAAAATRAKARD